MKWPAFYFPWLQKDNPTGVVDRLPELKDGSQTSVPGVYCVGDLTGIPLIKLAAESGYQLIEQLAADEQFKKDRESRRDDDVYDLIMVGAGPAGISACLRAAELGLKHLLLESSLKFNTIVNFPAGKPIYVTPEHPPMQSALKFTDGSKESLLDELKKDIEGKPLPVREGEMVRRISRDQGRFKVETAKDAYYALRVVVAIGKTGNARQLGVPGERLPKVYTRLIDPGEFKDRDILVVGGGDSAIEAAVALADHGNQVTLSYRKDALSRPKEQNLAAFDAKVKSGGITALFGSQVEEIKEKEVIVNTPEGRQNLKNDVVLGLIGTEVPVEFFKRSGIKLEGERDLAWWTQFIAMVSFFSMLYFGKSGFAVNILGKTTGLGEAIMNYLSAPFTVAIAWGLKGHAWYSSLNFMLGWLGSVIFLVSGSLALALMLGRPGRYFGTAWGKIKYGYLIACAVLYTWMHFSNILSRNAGWVEEPTYWYSLLYTTTIILFGIRRMQVKPTRYIIYQTLVLMGIQTLFLFLLPFYLYDGVLARVFEPDSWLISEVFPKGKWSSFGLILFWPLSLGNFGTSTFWIWFPFVQTFGILLFLVHRWGKGAYCGWICSCGAMAETFGDEYRTVSPHGPLAKKLENIGQMVLWFVVFATALHFSVKWANSESLLADTVWGAYKFSINVIFAGVLGLGVYFFMGGRIWCRYGCPLAALMHIYARFTRYRIMSNKKRCISCNLCTKVCHMGIDVMGYANKGVPMNDVECVRCSACVVNCPMQVLNFGDVGKSDPDNHVYKKGYLPLVRDWKTGLPDKDVAMLLAEEQKNHPDLK
ncbi:NAD(P)-binding domain-containing protein [Fibrobacterota bacterium]